ncbi:DegT/DnrJ/EryC1/StrS family aminotransferase [Bacteroides sp. AM16-24]|uniref:DegT/DnrJ/EryC1/StrS family aminotransferase n=1 Tax=Bacteroides sp. AM16-24 TaxID=2292002 RepID=UPI000E5217AF|nr:DegT/DnrJ/EryC1/StrS family aminotransferase [Bacteroides sp. AM16-24]RHI08340.1 DegT/DnrJ/EryC1/StrS family aminotransferase [Bacteroides sp. AM16-24]
MQFRDLKKQYQVLKQDMDAALTDTAASAAFIMGKPVKELEAELAAYVGVKHCVSCANGTDALTLALKTWGIGKGDAVFVPDFTFFSSAEVVSLEGATPVFVDVDKDTFNLDAADLEEKIGETVAKGELTPKVIITVDLFGLPADYPRIRKIADTYRLLILEDGAQGFGGEISGKKACGFGDISTTSFFPAKPLGCYGDGGAVFTDNDEWAALLDSYRVHGKGQFKYDNVRIGMNSRLDTLQAAVLKIKLKAFREYEVADINRAAARYTEKLQGKVKTPVVPEGYYSSWAQYTIRLDSKEQRDALQAVLKEQGIPTMVYYPTPMHDQTAYKNLKVPVGSCPVAEQLCHTVLSLPIHPYISEEDIDSVCEGILTFIAKK